MPPMQRPLVEAEGEVDPPPAIVGEEILESLPVLAADGAGKLGEEGSSLLGCMTLSSPSEG